MYYYERKVEEKMAQFKIIFMLLILQYSDYQPLQNLNYAEKALLLFYFKELFRNIKAINRQSKQKLKFPTFFRPSVNQNKI